MLASGPKGFYEELKRRHVIRSATLYIIAFWPIVQVVDILTPALGLPADEEVARCANDLFTVMMTAANEAVKAMHEIAVVYVVDRFRSS